MPLLRVAVVPLTLLALGLSAGTVRAQIVNVMPLLTPVEDGFGGSIEGSLTWKTGNVDYFLGKASLLLRYQLGEHRLISMSSAELGIKNGEDFNEKVFTHLRWQWAFHERVTWETYGQVASDRFKRLRLRALGGTGPRVSLYRDASVDLAAALSYMFEHERLNNATSGADALAVDNNHRASAYFTATFVINERVSLVHTTFYQPRLDAPGDDFRVLSDTDMVIQLAGALALTVGFDITYDSDPPADVKPLDAATSVALTVTF